MTTTILPPARRRGSALLTVVIIMVAMAILSASIISYSLTERRLNERERLVLNTRNAAENVVNYAAAQVSTKLYRLSNSRNMRFASGANQIYLPPANTVLQTEFGSAAVEVHAGIRTASALTYIDPQDSANSSNPNKGLSVITSMVPIIARATITNSNLGAYTAYTQQDLSVVQIPLYQFAIFYNSNLEFGPGLDMTIQGPVHTNGILAARMQDNHSCTLEFKERVTAVGGYYANQIKLGSIYNQNGTENTDPGGDGNIYFNTPSGTRVNIKSGSLYRDHTWSTNATGSETTTSVNSFRSFATTNLLGNLRTQAHGVEVITPPGVLDASAARFNAARITIEPASDADTPQTIQFKFSRRAGLYIIVNPTPTTRNGTLPDATLVSMAPYSYRCWLNTPTSTSTTVTNTLLEVVLPGQPSYGTNGATENDLPNRFTNLTAVGSNQILRTLGPAASSTPKATYTTVTPNAGTNFVNTAWPLTTRYQTGTPTLTSFSDGYFYDLRRARNSNGFGSLVPARSISNAFTPRPISKIDFDMTRFRLAVARTLYGATTSPAIYNPDVPNSSNWSTNILRTDANTTTVNLGPRTGLAGAYVYTTYPVTGTGTIASDPFRIYKATAAGATPEPLNSSDFMGPWYDGIAIYIHSVDAEDRTETSGVRNRPDSGVRLINGRGYCASLTIGGTTGCSIATNDAAYIVGHLNANGSITSTSSSTPDSSTNEYLCNVMADALTVLSQPEYGTSSGYYVQTKGWSDSLSANRRSSSGWSSAWQTTAPSSSNQIEGIDNTRYAGRTPTEGSYSASPTSYGGATYANAPSRSTKFDGADTEISSCLLQGIVRTTSPAYPRRNEVGTSTPLPYEPAGYQNSGGVHNFPRMSEYWNGTLAIRGSMVAMFESEVACEPWLATRVYSAPTRAWGLHTNLRADAVASGKHDVPLEPTVIQVNRWHFTALSPAEYNTLATEINGYPD